MLRMVICALLLAVSIQTPAAGDTVRLRADAWCPLNCEPGSDPEGYLIDIAREAFAIHGMTVDYRLMPWPRVLAEGRSGRIDGAIGSDSVEAEGMVMLHPLVLAKTVIAVRSGTSLDWTGVGSLAGRRVAAAQDYSYDGGPLDRYLRQHAGDTVMLVGGDDITEQLLRLLLNGRVDAIVEVEDVLRHTAARMDGGDRIQVAGVVATRPVGISFAPTPQGRRYAELLAAGVEDLRDSGRLSRILASYGLTDPAAADPAATPSH